MNAVDAREVNYVYSIRPDAIATRQIVVCCPVRYEMYVLVNLAFAKRRNGSFP